MASAEAEVDHKTAVLLLAKGRELPAFLAKMDLRSRVVCVTAIDNFTPLPLGDLLYETLLIYPTLLAERLKEPTGEAEAIGYTLDELAKIARGRAAEWSLEDLTATYLAAGHKVADITAMRTETKWLTEETT
jgi:hypothetical protein